MSWRLASRLKMARSSRAASTSAKRDRRESRRWKSLRRVSPARSRNRRLRRERRTASAPASNPVQDEGHPRDEDALLFRRSFRQRLCVGRQWRGGSRQVYADVVMHKYCWILVLNFLSFPRRRLRKTIRWEISRFGGTLWMAEIHRVHVLSFNAGSSNAGSSQSSCAPDRVGSGDRRLIAVCPRRRETQPRATRGSYSVVGGRARVLAVEEPGVEFLDDPPDDGDDAHACRPEFLALFTLDRWATTIADAIQAAQKLPGVDASRTLVIGISEGGIVAMRVSNVLPEVTHAASLSGGGPVYSFHMAEFMRSRGLDPEREVYACWSDILKDPDSTTKFCWGQTYRQWSSFMKTSVIAEALKSHALLYFVHGTADGQQSIAGFDVLRAELAAKQRDAVFGRIEGADHALDLPNQKVPEGLEVVFGRLVDWFLGMSSAEGMK